MDLRDFQILLELNRQPFASHQAIGRAVGVTGPAVKARLHRMETQGVLRGFQVVPAARIFRRYWRIFAYRRVDPSPNLQDLLEVEDVVAVGQGDPGTVAVSTFVRAPDAVPPAGLSRIFKRPPDLTLSRDSPQQFSAAESVLSPLDWRVLDALWDNPRAALAELAGATGLSARTVRKRRDALVSKGLIAVAPIIETAREPGLIVYTGYMMVERRADLDRIRARGLSVVSQVHEPPSAAILGYAATYAEVQEVERTLRAIPGARLTGLGPLHADAVATRRLRGWIQEELQRWKALRRDTRVRAPRGRTRTR